MNKDERIEKAVNGALHLFAELGMTIQEVGETTGAIKWHARLQSDETKIDPQLIQNLIQQERAQRDEEVARATKAVFGNKE